MAVKRLTPITSRHNNQMGDAAATIYSQEAYCYPPVSEREASAASTGSVRAELVGSARKWTFRYGVPVLANMSKVVLSHAEYDLIGSRLNNYHNHERIAQGFDQAVDRLDQLDKAGGAAGAIATEATFSQRGQYYPY